jgi:UDP-N-acetylmuramoyl-L-alanyl-D-glutamate--2,6-diaminopimelate ligase
MALEMPLIGRFNAENALTVLAMLLEWGVPPAEACAALARCHAPPGRMEAFGVRGGTVLAVVDYAHSPDALAKALDAARAHCRGALWIVFGCGGDRDAGKRPLMGRIAAERADRLIVTDDNPRTEDPRHIVAQILEGVRQAANAGATPAAAPAAARTRMIHDRAVAIRTALAEAREGDVVLIAGKGHEQYQICGREARPFSDQAIVREAVGTST